MSVHIDNIEAVSFQQNKIKGTPSFGTFIQLLFYTVRVPHVLVMDK